MKKEIFFLPFFSTVDFRLFARVNVSLAVFARTHRWCVRSLKIAAPTTLSCVKTSVCPTASSVTTNVTGQSELTAPAVTKTDASVSQTNYS